MGIWAQSLERALPAITSFISEKSGIEIVRSGEAATDGKVIYLPKLPELELKESDVVQTVAYIYHECGHIKHSDFSLSGDTPLKKAITGILEDIRIESLEQRRMPAARRYFGHLIKQMIANGAASPPVSPCFIPPVESDSEARILQWYMMFKLRHDVLLQHEVKPVLEPTVKVAEVRLSAGMRVRLDALMYQVTNCESESEVFELADEIIKMIEEEKEKEAEKDSQNGNGSPPPEDSSKDGQSGASGESGDGKDPEKTASENSSGPGEPQSLDQLLAMPEEEIVQGIGQMLENAINQTAVEAMWSEGSTQMPNVYPMRLKQSPVNMMEVRASINAIRTKTLNWMSSASETDRAHARAGINLDFSRLHAVPFGGDIFVRECEGVDLNAAVSILIDRSGSMSSMIKHAAYAGMTTMLAYDVPGIATQVAVFPVYDGNDQGVGIIKRWHESPRDFSGRIAGLTTYGCTPMAEAMLWAATDLVRRKETLRIIIVVTDGYPDNLAAARNIVRRARADNIAVVGIGIGVDPSSVFDQRYSASITDINELSSVMVRLVKASMNEARSL